MKVDKLKVEEGIMSINGKRRMCPYASVETAGLKSQQLCGEWCALFTFEVPATGKFTVNIGCAGIQYVSM